ncbi:effector-associated constant component EACC1 [Dactylosporangium matsuzakiense]|uniref:Uncharacterized protein n=1 Tax=Dactylosporangium matsuzakiense TaxID=53360 RepID=A0A9W6NL35_9ACTN|nr:hypothetical protein [Dactylosporangium matsuzakiense]UWZ41144.1 hypothetical protein Dmats_25915 [Dactylosporangium matsuzakiense]GLL00944.1 hypothetical protein GCM10017581_026850 [Dactylosporangium matsuzakiense]
MSAFTTLSTADRSVIRRCSVPDAFDAEVYAAVLQGDGRPLPELVASRCIEPTSSTGRRFRVPEPMRRDGLASWWTDAGLAPLGRPVPPALAELAGSLATECADERADLGLRALIIADPQAARQRFAELFAARDAALNLPGCQDLLDIVTSPELTDLAGAELLALCADRARHLRARTLWLPSWRRTQRYQARRAVDAALERLLADPPDAAAGDGPGGPQHRALRLYASGGMGKSTSIHRFIAHRCVPDRVPCALIDFDFTDVFAILQHPALVLLEWARQLNPQCPGAPFQELLTSFDAVRAGLLPTEAERALASLLPPSTATAPPAPDADLVRELFREALDEGGPAGPVLVVLDTFEEPALRGERLGDLLRLLRDTVAAVPALRLVVAGRRTAAEDRQTDSVRDLGWKPLMVEPFNAAEAQDYLRDRRGVESAPLRAVIVERAEGVPWLLGVYADLVTYTPDITAAQLAAVDPEVAWCLDRVVDRIDGGLQWFVRYGVVPRRLSRDLAEAVVMPHLRAALAGTEDDRPDRDPESAQRGTFPAGLAAPDFDALWERLLDYAAEGSWVGRHDSTVVFHPTFAKPMRRLLEGQSVLARLHADAASFFARRAAEDPGNAPHWIAEEVYHRLHLDPRAAQERWRAAVAAAGDPLGVIRLCDELLHADVVHLVPQRWQAAAHAERAWAEALLMRSTGRADRWDHVDRDLTRASGGFARRSAHAASLVAKGSFDSARGSLPSGDDAEIVVLRAEIEAGLGRPERAWAELGRLSVLPPSGVMLVERLAADADRLPDPAGPLAIVRRFGDKRLRLPAAVLLLAGGSPVEAQEMLRPDRSDRAVVLRAEAARRAARPEEAVRLLDGRDGPEVLRARARALCDLHEFDNAVALFDRLYDEALGRRDVPAALTALLDAVEVCLAAGPGFRAAQARLGNAQRLTVADEHPEAVRRTVLRALVVGDVEPLHRLLPQVAGVDRLTVATAGLALSTSDAFLAALYETLGLVQPPAARAFRLGWLHRRSEPLPDDRLLALCAGGRGPLWTLHYADVVRLTLGPAEALDVARPAAVELAAPYAWVAYTDLAVRCGFLPPPGVPAALPGLEQFPAVHAWYERRTGGPVAAATPGWTAADDDLAAWGVRVDLALTGDGRVSLRVAGTEAELFGPADPFVAALLDPAYHDLSRFLAEPHPSGLVTRLRELGDAGPRQLRLVTRDSRLATVPWELFLPARDDGGWCWRSAAEEGPGSPYRRQAERIAAETGAGDPARFDSFWPAVRELPWGPRPDGEFPAAVVLEPFSSSHGPRELTGRASYDLDLAGFMPVLGLREGPGAIVYVQGIMEDSAGVPRISFGGITGYYDVDDQGPAPLGVTVLDAWLARQPTPPVVILDIPLPPRRTEAMRQVLLRNDFADQLLRAGNTPAVVATGAIRPAAPLVARELIRPGTTAADLYRALRQNHSPDGPGELTALFAAVPADALPIVRFRRSTPAPPTFALSTPDDESGLILTDLYRWLREDAPALRSRLDLVGAGPRPGELSGPAADTLRATPESPEQLRALLGAIQGWLSAGRGRRCRINIQLGGRVVELDTADPAEAQRAVRRLGEVV